MKIVGYLIGAVGLIAVSVLLMALPLMWLGNYLFTPVILNTLFGVSQLDFVHALALSVFMSICFKGTSSSSKD